MFLQLFATSNWLVEIWSNLVVCSTVLKNFSKVTFDSYHQQLLSVNAGDRTERRFKAQIL